jgi:hypothetical protein
MQQEGWRVAGFAEIQKFTLCLVFQRFKMLMTFSCKIFMTMDFVYIICETLWGNIQMSTKHTLNSSEILQQLTLPGTVSKGSLCGKFKQFLPRSKET